jgi:hypothetical protein
MTEYIWAVAAVVSGCALGLLFVGYLIKPAIRSWEGTQSMQRLFFGVAVFLVGSGGGAGILAAFPSAPPWYGAGGGAGMVWGCFHQPVLLASYTLETVTHVVRLSDSLRDKVADVDERSATILALLAPPTSEKKSKEDIAKALDAGLDKLAND